MLSENTRRRILKIIAGIAALVFLIAAANFLIGLWEEHNAPTWEETPTMEKTLEYGGKEYRLRNDVETFLLIGLDSEEQEQTETFVNDKRADFLLLLVTDPAAKTFRAIRVNRDTIAKVNVLGVAGERLRSVDEPIALAHVYGNGREVSCRNTADAVSALLLHAKIDHYLSVVMDAIPVINDRLGGVEVTVKDDFTGVDDTLVLGQKVTLFGDHVMNFIRSRSSMPEPTNLNRMARQREYLEGLYAKVRENVVNNDEIMVEIAKEILDDLVSDVTGERLYEKIRTFSGYEMAELYDLDGTSRVGKNAAGEARMEFYPSQDSLTQIVIDCFYREK